MSITTVAVSANVNKNEISINNVTITDQGMFTPFIACHPFIVNTTK
jgi:hypothetical protein